MTCRKVCSYSVWPFALYTVIAPPGPPQTAQHLMIITVQFLLPVCIDTVVV